MLLSGLFLGTLAMLNILGISRFVLLASYGPGADGAAWAWRWGQTNFPAGWHFAVAVGVLPYPITFLCTDLISEFYGLRRANFVVFVGLLINGWVVFVLWLGGVLPGFVPNDVVTGMPPLPTFDAGKGAFIETGWTFYQVRNLTFGAVTASMIAYLTAQLVDVQLFHFWKRVTKGCALWVRNNASTMVSQLVDTVSVILITHFYAHALPIEAAKPLWPQLALFILTGYAFKFAAALVDTPVIYAAVYGLKRYLQIDPAQPNSE